MQFTLINISLSRPPAKFGGYRVRRKTWNFLVDELRPAEFDFERHRLYDKQLHILLTLGLGSIRSKPTESQDSHFHYSRKQIRVFTAFSQRKGNFLISKKGGTKTKKIAKKKKI